MYFKHRSFDTRSPYKVALVPVMGAKDNPVLVGITADFDGKFVFPRDTLNEQNRSFREVATAQITLFMEELPQNLDLIYLGSATRTHVYVMKVDISELSFNRRPVTLGTLDGLRRQCNQEAEEILSYLGRMIRKHGDLRTYTGRAIFQ